jgi:hypothetical protein
VRWSCCARRAQCRAKVLPMLARVPAALARLVPGWRANRLSLADGLSPRG